jgi:hypothetical protein
MDDPDVLNEGIGEEEEGVEDMMETENVGDEYPSHVQDGGHPLCCDADQGRMVLPTPKIAVAYSAKCRGFCLIAGGRYPLHVYEQKDQDDYAVRRCFCKIRRRVSPHLLSQLIGEKLLHADVLNPTRHLWICLGFKVRTQL